jgi:transcription-repair coupling factor (superfamily II helicase)
MPGDEEAFRIVFEFDTVEEIRRFDPADQSSRPEREGQVTLRPVKEIVWNEERRSVLAGHLAKIRSYGREKADMVAAALSEFGEIKGEEFFFPLAFDKAGSLFDYLPEGAVVFLVEREAFRTGRGR